MNIKIASTSIFRPAIILMSGRMLGFVATFIIPIVLVRIFDQGEFGTYKQLFLIYATLYGVAQLGMAESLFYFLPAANSRNAGRYALNAIIVLVASGMLCLIIMVTLRYRIAGWLGNSILAEYLPLLGVFLLFMLGATVLEIVMISRKRYLSATGTYIASDYIRAVLCILAAVATRNLEWVLFGLILFSALRIFSTLIYLWRIFKNKMWISAGFLKTQFAYAIPFSIAVLIEIIRSQLHMYAVSYRYDSAMFAVYAVGCLQIPLVDFMMTSTSNVLMVKMQEYIHAGDHASLLEIWHDTTRKLMLIFVPLVGGLLIVADKFIIVLFTKNYSGSIHLFMIWTLTILFSTLLTDSFLRTYAKTGYLILLNLVQLVIIVATIGILMKLFGMAGAVMSTLLAIAISKVLAILKIRSILKSTFNQVLPWNSMGITLVVGALSAIPALSVKAVLDIPNIPLVIVTGMTYLATYICLLLLSGLLSMDERKSIMTLVKWPLIKASRF